MALIVGGKSPHLDVSRADSIENRLIKLLLYLRQNRPTEGWDQFLTADGGLRWESIAVAGQVARRRPRGVDRHQASGRAGHLFRSAQGLQH